MNKGRLKTYAPAARLEFIKAVTERVHFYGISKEKAEPCTVQGDFAFITGRAFPKGVVTARTALLDQIDKSSFPQVIEEVAYTWFNRIAAIRFMEVNGYLSHGYRVLSHPEGHAEPEILEKAQFIERLDGLERGEIIRLKMAAGKENELYRRLLIAQCNDLNAAMPFLFERLDDPTELLLPDNLLNTDSVIRHMVSEIPEDDWKEVEIIGWLYQFYISEKKDSLMKAKKAYRTEDIPAVTQLFTPNWIVKYMVQNSLGAKWLSTYPASGIKSMMKYYIEPALQDEDVKARLKEITPTALNPEELTVIDPASGSGHILVEAYDLLKLIYLERGYREKDIPALILTRNLFGLEIDERAAQLSGFAVMMKARADDREIFRKDVRPSIVCLKSSNGEVAHFKEAKELITLFENAMTYGSLIRVPSDLRRKLPEIGEIADRMKSGNMFEQKEAEIVTDLLKQADLLSRRYDCVIANPPYMGGKGMNATLKEFARSQYPDTKSDLFAMFIERGFEMAKDGIGHNAMVTMQSWMFLSSFEKCREFWLETKTIQSMAHLGARAFSTISGEVVTVTSFSSLNCHLKKYRPSFLRLIDGDEEEKRQGIINKSNLFNRTIQDDFKKIPGSPIAYWVSERFVSPFVNAKELIHDQTISDGQTKTGDNDKFLRQHWEVESNKVGVKEKWWQHPKGGTYRKWYGNVDWVIDWSEEARKHYRKDHVARILPEYLWGKKGISWTLITSGEVSFRTLEPNQIFNLAAPSLFFNDEINIPKCLGFLNTKYVAKLLKVINPTLNMNVGEVRCLPLLESIDSRLSEINQTVANCLSVSRKDWDSYETSWDFEKYPLLRKENRITDIARSYERYRDYCRQMTDQMKQLEEENNRIFIEAYGLQDELTPDVPIEEITLFANPHYRYRLSGEWLVASDEQKETELERRMLEDTMKELISYAVGCMMGRYSLDMPGLVYAHAGNKDFDRIVARGEWRVASGEGRGARGEWRGASGEGRWTREQPKNTNHSSLVTNHSPLTTRHFNAVTSEGGGDTDDKELQGYDRLAEGDGLSRTCISGNKTISERGTVRADESDTKGCGLGSIEYSGRAGKTINSGVQELPIHIQGFSGRSGDSDTSCSTFDLPVSADCRGSSCSSGGSKQDDQFINQQTCHSPLTTNHSPLVTRHLTYVPDEDGIIPITEREWFDDDAGCRFSRFIETAWDKKGLDANLDFIADAIGRKSGESGREVIRRYFADAFFKDHCQTYKNRPIYWLFSSGKEKAFQAIVYLHRYNEGTLSRMRTEYVLPLQTRIARQIEHLEKDRDAVSGSAANKIQREIIALRRQQAELLKFDELLRHYADKKIMLDLDDGVKVNYAKFGGLLADVKKIIGKDNDEQREDTE